MKPIKFHGSNVVFAENQNEYQPLPAHRNEFGEVTSCWKLTFRERIKILFRGKMWLMMMTFNNPPQPVFPMADDPIPDYMKPRAGQ